MKSYPFTFEKKDGKWKSQVNPAFLVEMQQTYGFPIEMSKLEIEQWTPLERLAAEMNSWREFAKEHKIELQEIQEDLHAHKAEVMEDIHKIIK